MTDLIIAGAGCAGLTAAVYAVRAGLSVMVFEKLSYGGQIAITNEIENYPSFQKISGPQLAQKIYDQAVANGVEIRLEEVVNASLEGKEKQVTTTAGEYNCRAFILANGVKRRTLGCPGEEEFTGRGVSYCATCDGAFFRGKHVVVVGGGNTALEDALFLANLCERVTIVHRRNAFTAQKVLVDAIPARKNIEILWDTTVTAIEGSQKVERVQLNCSDEPRTFSADGVFIAIGLVPDNQTFAALGLDEQGYVLAGEDCKTRLPGVFAAGDTRSKEVRQIITAAADGAVAATMAAHQLNRNH